MARFYGKVGFLLTQENEARPGVWESGKVVEKTYYGDITRCVHRWDRGDKVNDDLTISNTISIVADAYAFDNYGAIRYVELGGTKWRVTEIETQRPRLILSLGGVWND